MRLFFAAFVLAATAQAQSPTTLIDNFSLGTDAAWTRIDVLASYGLGSTVYNATSGRYNISSAGVLPAIPNFVPTGSAWTASISDQRFTQGSVRAKVRLNNTASNALIAIRMNTSSLSGYFFALNNVENRLVIARADSGVQSQTAYAATPFTITENTDYIIEGTSIGSTHALKAWLASQIEPASPQLTLTDSNYSTGAIVVATYNQWSTYLGVGGAISASFDDVEYRCPSLSIAIAQPSGPGTGLFVLNSGLRPGAQYFNAFSPEPCSAPVGLGPYFGLCASNPSFLIWQASQPVGSQPFRFIASGASSNFGPYSILPGIVIDARSFEIMPNGSLGCISQVIRFTVP